MNGSAGTDDLVVESMDCTDFVLLADDLITSDPTEWGRIVTKHLDECPPCLVYLQQMQDLQVLLHHAAHGSRLDSEGVDRVLRTLTTIRRMRVMTAERSLATESAAAGLEHLDPDAWSVGEPVDGTTMRATMGAYPSGVTVLTTRLGDRPVGMTISSFASVSMDPPLILQCVGRNAGSLPAFTIGRPVAVNVLAHDQASVTLKFASRSEDRFADVETQADTQGSPVLVGSAAWVSGFIDRIYDAGDHIILLIMATGVRRSGKPPLLYHSGQMHDWTEAVPPPQVG